MNAAGIALGLDDVVFEPDRLAALFYRPDSRSGNDGRTAVVFGSGDVVFFADSDEGIDRCEGEVERALRGADLV